MLARASIESTFQGDPQNASNTALFCELRSRPPRERVDPNSCQRRESGNLYIVYKFRQWHAVVAHC